jgi:hypothetical protein
MSLPVDENIVSSPVDGNTVSSPVDGNIVSSPVDGNTVSLTEDEIKVITDKIDGLDMRSKLKLVGTNSDEYNKYPKWHEYLIDKILKEPYMLTWNKPLKSFHDEYPRVPEGIPLVLAIQNLRQVAMEKNPKRDGVPITLRPNGMNEIWSLIQGIAHASSKYSLEDKKKIYAHDWVQNRFIGEGNRQFSPKYIIPEREFDQFQEEYGRYKKSKKYGGGLKKLGRKSRKQNKSRKQGKSRKQRKTRK